MKWHQNPKIATVISKSKIEVSESLIQSQVIAGLYRAGVLVERIQSTGMFDPVRKVYRTSNMTKGIADLFFANPDKKLYGWLEVKAEDDFKYIVKHYDDLQRPSNNKRKQHFYEQIKFLHKYAKAGMVCAFVCSLDAALMAVDGGMHANALVL